MRRLFAGVAVVLSLVAAVWGGWCWVEEQRYRSQVAQAEREMAGGRYRLARQHLADLVQRRPGSSEAAYQLGRCEEQLGQPDAALSSWSRIAADSPLYAKASLGRAWLLINSGRLAQAEAVLEAIPDDQGPDALPVRQAREHLLRLEGRVLEARALIIASWRGAPDPSFVLKRLYILEDAAFPLDYVKRVLAMGSPEDDRVGLGLANIAIWQGRFDEAARRLDDCAGRRPRDQAVWLARLSLATSTGDVDAARRAVEHLQAAWVLPFEVYRLRAWFASFRGDAEVERRYLGALLAEEPGNTNAWARLAELALKAGRGVEAATLRRKQAEASDRRERYTHLLMGDDSSRHATELARLARELGRPIEARGWALIQQGQAAHQPLWPDPAIPAHPAKSGGMLASLMDDLLPRGDASGAQPAPANAVILPAMTDDAAEAGLRFSHDNGHTSGPLRPPEVMCGGVGLLDYDGDGWLDVYVVQGGPFPPSGSLRSDGDRLFRNRGDGTFVDVTESAGITSFPRGYGHGVAVGDYDNDGRPDLFVTRWRSYALYHNRGDGQFEDVTELAGLGGDRDWPTSSAFADLDGDGDLDLYVCHYFAYDPANPKRCEHRDRPGSDDCMPRDYPSLPDHVFRNDGGRFVDVTASAGFVDPDGRGLGILAADLDDDNKVDLYVANDMSANYLFRNRGGFRFEETGHVAGTAASADGLYKSGMGIACGDLDGDGTLDLAVTNFFGESTTFFRNLGSGLFVDHTAVIGLQAPSRPLLGFGVAFLDVNNDGWLDLLATNGHVLDARPRIPWTMPLQLLVGGPGGHLTDVSDRTGAPFRRLHLGRGLAVGDLDNDGRLDALVLDQNQPLVYLRNRTEPPGHFVRFSLEGTRSNRDAVGARVTITSGGRRRMSERVGGGSYQSASDPRLHFGLGDARQVDSIDVRWPSGQVDHHAGLSADREYRLREGAKPREVKNDRRAPGASARHPGENPAPRADRAPSRPGLFASPREGEAPSEPASSRAE
jgi:tetratricopeptide (TPR) repeat protein